MEERDRREMERKEWTPMKKMMFILVPVSV